MEYGDGIGSIQQESIVYLQNAVTNINQLMQQYESYETEVFM